MTSRATYPLALAVCCALLAACNETATEPEPVTDPSAIEANVSAAAALSFWQVSAGELHTCGVSSDQRLYCWGYNSTGQLGDGTTTNRSRPTPVATALRFRQVSAGAIHTCAIATDDRIYCWGYNAFGQLGDGTTSDRRTIPAPVAGGLTFRSVAAGWFHTCGISVADNRAYCWGGNAPGTLGDGTTTDRPVPGPVRGTLRYRGITTGWKHTCAITTDNRAFCWGDNRVGQLGVQNPSGVTGRLTPTLVSTTLRFKQISAGLEHTCAVGATDGAAFCWGNGRKGRLGNGTTNYSFRPRPVAGGLTFRRVSGGNTHTCGETTGSRAYCWGDNVAGMLGDGTTIMRLTPVAVRRNLFFSQLDAGQFHTCGKTSAGAAYCWGDNSFGAIGDGTSGNTRLTPTAVAGP
jgi:alpha-tubulin suppressor-like RCC1 family protein